MEKDPAVRDRRPEEVVAVATQVKAAAVAARPKDRDPVGAEEKGAVRAGAKGPEDRGRRTGSQKTEPHRSEAERQRPDVDTQ